jgi:BirA family biotin operon repressor/biotin-[acetyl-CoA-carboxylase] ligase
VYILDGKVIKALSARRVDVIEFELIDSTNAEAKRMATSLYESRDLTPRLLVAKEQTAGRGRMGRSFLSRAGRGIFMSLLYFTDKPLADAVSVTTAAAAIVAEAIEEVTGNPMRIKWVNDIYNEKGKVCGILAETVAVDVNRVAVVVGIGINVGDDEFPKELRNIASSIGDVGGKEETLVASIVGKLLIHAENPSDNSYMAEYRKRFMLQDVDVNILKNDEIVGSGRVLGVDDSGGLVLLPDGGEETITLHTGEVTIRKKGADLFGAEQKPLSK